MTGAQILMLVVALLVLIAAVTAVWLRKQRTGGVLIAETAATSTRSDRGEER